MRVVPCLADRFEPVFESRVAFKKFGRLGGRVRSRSIVSQPTRLVLQNDGSAEENRELVAAYAPSWHRRAADMDANVRRCDVEPLLIMDLLTGQSFTRGDCLKPVALRALLCDRVEAAAGKY